MKISLSVRPRFSFLSSSCTVAVTVRFNTVTVTVAWLPLPTRTRPSHSTPRAKDTAPRNRRATAACSERAALGPSGKSQARVQREGGHAVVFTARHCHRSYTSRHVQPTTSTGAARDRTGAAFSRSLRRGQPPRQLRERLHKDSAHPCHICTGVGSPHSTSARGRGSPTTSHVDDQLVAYRDTTPFLGAAAGGGISPPARALVWGEP